MDGSVLVRRRRDRFLGGDVVGDNDAGDRALVEGDANGPVDEMAHLHRIGRHLHVLVRDIFEEGGQVDLLLVASAKRGQCLLSDDRDDRLVVELGVVETVQQMNRAWTGGCDANANLAGELRMAARHECRHLLMARLDELRIAAGPVESAEKRIDPVAGITVDAPNAPLT